MKRSVFFKPTILYALCLMLLAAGMGLAQQKKEMTVEWIYSDDAGNATALPAYFWLRDGTALIYDRRQPKLQRTFERFDPQTGKREPALDMRKALASLQTLINKEDVPEVLTGPTAFDESGRSVVYEFGGDIFLLDLAGAQFRRLTKTEAEEKSVSMSPDGQAVAFVRNNDLYAYDLKANKENRLTTDGSETMLNGTLSWVYWEEVFGRHDTGYWWSKDSKSIAYMQTDESPVSVSTYTDFQPWQPRVIKQRYPKAGEPNPRVRVGIVSLDQPQTTWVDLNKDSYEYIVRVGWLPDSSRVSVETLNRKQDALDLYFADRATGKTQHILKETDDAWVNIYEPFFLKDGKRFIWPSERTGYAHLYLYTMDGKQVNQITKGDWSLRPAGMFASYGDNALLAVDEKENWAYFTAQEKSSIEQQLYRIKLDGSGMQRLSQGDGFHVVRFSPDNRYYFDRYSNISTMPSLELHQNDGKTAQMLAGPRPEMLAQFGMQYPELMTIPAADGFQMPAQMLKPKNFDPKKKYPVIIFVYGGASSPTVINQWNGLDNYFNQILLNKGYLVMTFDNRASTGISHALEKTIKGQMYGDVELNDLKAAVKWTKAQPYIDGNRVGLWGWSGGGIYTLLGMTRTQEFKAGIAVAAVTDQRFYDTRWTESVMKTPQDNLQGYEKVSLLKSAKDLHGRLLLVHGTYDDNVHIQNAWAFTDELIKANKMFDMMIYPMRQHPIIDKPARIHLYTRMVEFWTANL
ncbi:MAG: S9 family peptidase [Pyrinomonadaceae bacterium]